MLQLMYCEKLFRTAINHGNSYSCQLGLNRYITPKLVGMRS